MKCDRSWFVVGIMMSVIAASTSVGASELLNSAFAQYKIAQYNAAIGLFQKAADEGEPLAMYYLGEMYSKGQGVTADLARAEQWYVQYAEHETVDKDHAWLALGLQYYFGDRVKENWGRAELWFVKASDAGNTLAPFALYVLNAERKKDYTAALAWAELGANRGDPGAQIIVGELYGFGRQDWYPRNKDKALYWCSTAANNNAATNEMKVSALACVDSLQSGKGTLQDIPRFSD